jgi:hypothetical protein
MTARLACANGPRMGHDCALRKISKDSGAAVFVLEVTLVTFWIVTFGTIERRYVLVQSHSYRFVLS